MQSFDWDDPAGESLGRRYIANETKVRRGSQTQEINATCPKSEPKNVNK